MIRVLTFTAPLSGRGYNDAEKALNAAVERMQALNRCLLGVTVSKASQEVLRLTLRVSGRDRFNVQNSGRRIAAIILRRAGIDYRTAILARTEAEPTGHKLTKEQGRQPHASRNYSVGP